MLNLESKDLIEMLKRCIFVLKIYQINKTKSY